MSNTITTNQQGRIEYDKSKQPGASYKPVVTNDGLIPKVLGRNKAGGGMEIFENGATFTERAETLVAGGQTFNITVIDIEE